MLLKIRKIPAALGAPVITQEKGLDSVEMPTVGQLVRVPAELADRAEILVGEVSLTGGMFPLGIEIKLDAPLDHLNGLWVQRGVYDSLLPHAAVAS